ncbi:MAG: putative 2-aminoethylphosphonate ABC transporter permease subunit, partial [Shewanella sp.]
MEAKTMTMNTLASPNRPMSLFNRVSKDNVVLFPILLGVTCLLVLFLLLPLWSMLQKALQNSDGDFVGLSNFVHYLASPNVWTSISNTLTLGVTVTTIVTLAAFGYAFALTRSCMPFKGVFKALGTAPILAPSLLPAISLIFLFGNQGVAKSWIGDGSVYGLTGISLGLIFWTFPHALMILSTAMRTSDARLYEAAQALKTSPLKTFFIVTLPSAKFGLISTLIVVFTLVITDFGVAKVIGGNDNVLATDIFKQVVGQQNFAMGAVTSMILLFPAILAFVADRYVKNKQKNLMDTRSVIYQPSPSKVRDYVCFVYCSLVSLMVLVVLGMAVYGSLVTFWPWDKALTLNNYNFSEISTYGWSPFFNSLEMAFLTAIFGTTLIFIAAYAIEKGRAFALVRSGLQMMSIIPMAVPGMVLGLGYIFYFNDASNALSPLYGTMALLVISTVVHYYTVGHMTSLAALKQLPAEIEATAASIKMPQWQLFYKVTLPV